jgi:hypothetical protein
MREACCLIWTALVRLFRTRASLVAEILVLRHQINIQRRHLPKRQTFRIMDRLIFAGLYRLAQNVLNALAILKPETAYGQKIETAQRRQRSNIFGLGPVLHNKLAVDA